jgi:AcrR family transcriptional regulator
MAKAAKGEKTRDDIIQAGLRLFSQHGYFATSMNDILDAISMSKGAFYHHFKSKEDLVRAVLDKLQHDYQERLIQPSLAVKPGLRLKAALNTIVALNETGQWPHCLLLARLVQETAHQDSDQAQAQAVTELVQELIEFWQQVIEADQAAEALRGDLDSRILAEAIITTLLGAVICQQLEEDVTRLDRIVEQIQQLLII